MELKILQPKNKGRLKITLQKTGKFGFSSYAHSLLNLNEQKFAKFGSDKENNWFIKVQENKDEDSFKISKAGQYYYINMKDAIVEMGLKRGDNVIFDLVPSDDGYFKMCRR